MKVFIILFCCLSGPAIGSLWSPAHGMIAPTQLIVRAMVRPGERSRHNIPIQSTQRRPQRSMLSPLQPNMRPLGIKTTVEPPKGRLGATGQVAIVGPGMIKGQSGDFPPAKINAERGQKLTLKGGDKAKIFLGGNVEKGGTVTAEATGRLVSANVKTGKGGEGYIEDQRQGRLFKDDSYRKQHVGSEQVVSKDYQGRPGKDVSIKAHVEGPGAATVGVVGEH